MLWRCLDNQTHLKSMSWNYRFQCKNTSLYRLRNQAAESTISSGVAWIDIVIPASRARSSV